MKPHLPRLLAGITLFLATCLSSHAGDKAAVVTEEKTSPWSGELTTGWDSLYMFRGVNQLPGYHGYGSSISSTALSLTWAPTKNDSFTAATWMAFGIGESDYKEIDATLTYTRTIGALSLSAGYQLYTVLSEPGGLYSNELVVSAAYAFTLGPVTLTPGLNYDFTLGPEPGNHGYIPSAAGYLEARLDAEVPLYHEIITAAPWVAFGFSFGYNSAGPDESLSPFTGADHVELGLTVPIAITKSISLSPYVAYSRAWTNLAGTDRNTVWGGIALSFSF